MAAGEILCPTELVPLLNSQTLTIVRKLDSGYKHVSHDQTYEAILIDIGDGTVSMQGLVYEKVSEANKVAEMNEIKSPAGTEDGVSGARWTMVVGVPSSDPGEDDTYLLTLALTTY